MRQDRAEPNDPNALIDRGGLHGGDSCWLKVLRTMSSPLDKGAYRKDRSDLLVWFDRIVPTKDFSGLTNCACALARAAAIVPIVSLDRCMAALRIEEVEADRARF